MKKGQALEKKKAPVDLNATIDDPNSERLQSTVVEDEIDEDTAKYMEGLKVNIVDVEGGKLVGGYEGVVSRLGEKFEANNVPVSGEVMVLDSFDGARHVETKKKTVSIISFSSQICGKCTVNNNISTGSSFNILTWQKLKCEENKETMMPAVRDLYKEKASLLKDQRDNQQRLIPDAHLNFKELHDGKMVYCLTGHVQWNRKNHPFLLCKCMRGQGVRNNDDHVCELISHEDQVKYFNRSQRR